MRRAPAILLALLLAAPLWAAGEAPKPRFDPEEEKRIGKHAAEDIAKEFKFLDDEKVLARVQGIADRIAKVSARPDVKYEVHIIKGEQINAFAIAGGYIYVTEGLLKAVESDDELAGVIAHEIGHNSLYHPLLAMEKKSKMSNATAIGLLAGLVMGVPSVNLAPLAVVSNLAVTAVLTGYSREFEQQADLAALDYMTAAGYNPVGLLTVLEGLARMANNGLDQNLGIFQTHPFARDRARTIYARLKARGIQINRRLVTQSLIVKVEDATVNDATIGRVLLDNEVVFEPAVSLDGETPHQRAQDVADRLDQLLDRGLEMYQVTLTDDGAGVQARGVVILTVTPDDAAFHQKAAHDLATAAYDTVRRRLWVDRVNRAY